MNTFFKRTLSGILGLIILLLIIEKGSFYFDFAIILVSIIGLKEYYSAIKNIGIKPLKKTGYISTILLYYSYLNSNRVTMGLSLSIITITSLINFVFKSEVEIKDIAYTLLGILYIPMLLFHIIYFRDSIYIWFVFIIAFGTDTFAYISGMLFGKNKLCPKLSPKKTIEGSIGGIIGSTILSSIYAIYIGIDDIYIIIMISIISSIISQMGDLIASKIKRICKIKDYGKIMPGHGGVLDRFDSIILTSPVVYYLTVYFLN